MGHVGSPDTSQAADGDGDLPPLHGAGSGGPPAATSPAGTIRPLAQPSPTLPQEQQVNPVDIDINTSPEHTSRSKPPPAGTIDHTRIDDSSGNASHPREKPGPGYMDGEHKHLDLGEFIAWGLIIAAVAGSIYRWRKKRAPKAKDNPWEKKLKKQNNP